MPPKIPDFSENKVFAAQNARDGLINVSDLSLLTGLPPAELTKYSKAGYLNFHSEYHGKRLYDFSEIIAWASQPARPNTVQGAFQNALDAEMKRRDCPYRLEPNNSHENGTRSVAIVWKDEIPPT